MNKIEKLKEYVITKNLGECLSTEWITCHTKYKWKCQNGHTFEKLFNAIKKGEWCKQCTKVSISKCIDFASKHGGELLSTEYVDNKTKLKWKCRNNHVLERAWVDITRRRNFCPQCPKIKGEKSEKIAPKKKNLSIEDCQQEAEKIGGKCLETTYKNRRTLMQWICKNNHTFTLTLGAVRNNGRWCRECSVDKKRHDISIAHNLAEKYGGTCLSTEYINLETPMKWRCTEGHEWEVNMSNIKGSGSWCRMCYLRTRRDKAIKRVFNWVSILGGIVLTDKDNIPYDIRSDRITVDIKCNKDHIFTRSLYALQTGTWCPKCTYKSELACRDVFESIYTYKFPKKRLKCLEYLELDGYCEELSIALEYDGLHHTEYTPHFHRNGINDLFDIMSRDQKKNELCKKNGITLIRIPYTYTYNYPEELEKFIYFELERNGF